MSWHYSRALVEEFWAASYPDGGLPARWRSIPIAQGYCSSDKMTEFSRLSRFGMTFAPLTDDLGEELLTWFRADFLARTSAQPEKAKESQESVAASGWKWPESSVKYDPDMRLWKTRQCSLLGDSEWFSETWPRWGLMRDGECWELPKLEHRTSESACGLWPTPTSSMMTVGDMEQAKFSGSDPRRPSYAEANQMVATPTARDWKSGKASKETMERNSRPLSEQIGGNLNPDWVEWLMGWPVGWTSLKPLESNELSNWDSEPADIPRVAKDVPNRVGRLKAIGNGQVPQCAAEAWRILK